MLGNRDRTIFKSLHYAPFQTLIDLPNILLIFPTNLINFYSTFGTTILGVTI
jgi:hypothetical protein